MYESWNLGNGSIVRRGRYEWSSASQILAVYNWWWLWWHLRRWKPMLCYHHPHLDSVTLIRRDICFFPFKKKMCFHMLTVYSPSKYLYSLTAHTILHLPNFHWKVSREILLLCWTQATALTAILRLNHSEVFKRFKRLKRLSFFRNASSSNSIPAAVLCCPWLT